MQSQDRDLALNYAIAELRFSIAFITLHLLEIKAGFREDQPRGSDGRWSMVWRRRNRYRYAKG